MTSTLLKCSVLLEAENYRGVLVDLINHHPNLNLQFIFTDLKEAKVYIEEHPNELLFLKIEMDEGSGFAFLDSLPLKPNVIFMANDTKSAFKAFDYVAIDYLTLPIKKDRFLYAVEKALLHQKISTLPEIDLGEFIFVKCNLKKRKVYLKQLKYIQALGDYVKLITDDETFVVLSTMKAFEKELPETMFRRIHKSYIVNINRITRYNSKAVELATEVLPLSRNRKTELVDALQDKWC
jgi:DNA-binding LytR/AlgR family response regulator